MSTTAGTFSVVVSRSAGGKVVLTPRGALDAASARRLEEALLQLVDAGELDVLVDLTQTHVIEPAAAGMLVALAKLVGERGGDLDVTPPAPASLSLLPPYGSDGDDVATAAPLAADEPGRLAALHGLRILGTEREAAFDDLVRLAAKVCAAPMAAVTFVDAEDEWCKSAVGVEPWQAPRETAMSAWAILHDDLFVVADAVLDARFADSPLVTGDPKVRFYAAVPLKMGPHAVGALCVMDVASRTLTPDQDDDLRALGRQVGAQLELRARRTEVEADETAPAGEERLLRTKDVAQLFAVSERTVNYWAAQGRLRSRCTAGGHRRYAEEDVLALLRHVSETADSIEASSGAFVGRAPHRNAF